MTRFNNFSEEELMELEVALKMMTFHNHNKTINNISIQNNLIRELETAWTSKR